MDIPQDDLRTLLISSFRFALGRSTYITQDTSNIIKSHHTALSQDDKKQMIVFIKHHIKKGSAGHKIDKEAWLELKDFLEIN